MKKIGIYLLVATIFLTLGVFSPLYAQKPDSPNEDVGTYGLSILKVIPAARAAGMGQAFTGLCDDVNALEYNVSGLAFLNYLEAGVDHHEWLLDTRTTAIGLAFPLQGGKTGVLGIGLKYFDEGVIDETILENGEPVPVEGSTLSSSDISVRVGYGVQVAPGFSVGLAGNLTHIDLVGETTNAFSGDFGISYRNAQGFMVGISALHIGPQFAFDDKDEKLPFTIRGGLAKRFGGETIVTPEGHFAPRHGEEFNLAIDAVKQIDNKLKINVGGEAWFFNKTVAGRVGYRINEDIQGLTIGAGFRVKDFFFDYAFAPISEIEDKASHRVSLNWKRGYSAWEPPIAEPINPDFGQGPPIQPRAEPNRGPIEVKELADGTILVTLRVNFDFDKWNIRTDMEPILEQLAVVLNNYPNSKIKLEGHTDSIGSLEYNVGLSQRRAESVRSYLIRRLGFADSNLLPPVGYGKTRPIVPNTSAENRFMNRRTDLIVYKHELLMNGFVIPPIGASAVLELEHRVQGNAVEIMVKLNGNQVDFKEKVISPARDRHTFIVDLQEIYPLTEYSTKAINIGYVKQARVAYNKLSESKNAERIGYTRIAIDLSSKPWRHSVYQEGNYLIIRFE
ncbi:MAG: hypothetical protein B6244_01695 [Candidatus Cloacimonetes bacterium 4572_55]|nr:MAG: hypothetical protein B6244_01695 [Candidatus Cloacimonetes bacterium 4572_55]